MFPNRVDKSLHVLEWSFCLNDMSWSYHIAASTTQDFNLRLDIRLDLPRRTEGQKVLLIDGSPERKPVTKFAFQFFRRMSRNVRLNGVENFHPDFNPVPEDGSNGAVRVLHEHG